MSERQTHWQTVYTTKDPGTVSWYQPSADPSLRMIAASGIQPPARIIDVGGGASSLVDALLERGFQVTVLDIAEAALATSKARLGARAAAVDWQAADITRWRPNAVYDLWHDRAVFHFLVEEEDRIRYRTSLAQALRPGGFAVVATFAEDGPEKCSGLPVRRYSAAGLAEAFGGGFELVESCREIHVTPWGSDQAFTWALLKRNR